MTFDKRYAESLKHPQMFEGKDGKLYVKNPFNNDYASYAKYSSKDAYNNGRELPEEHINHDIALKQFDQKEYFEFKLAFGGKTETHITNLAGDLDEPIERDGIRFSVLSEYLKVLRQRYGDKLNFVYEKKVRG